MKLAVTVLAAGLAFPVPAWSDEKRGGHEVQVGKFHVELVVKDSALSLYVRDAADKPIDPKSVKASANVLSGKEKAVVALSPSDKEVSTGKAPFTVGKDSKVIVTFSVAGGKSEQARFSLGQKQDHKDHKH